MTDNLVFDTYQKHSLMIKVHLSTEKASSIPLLLSKSQLRNFCHTYLHNIVNRARQDDDHPSLRLRTSSFQENYRYQGSNSETWKIGQGSESLTRYYQTVVTWTELTEHWLNLLDKIPKYQLIIRYPNPRCFDSLVEFFGRSIHIENNSHEFYINLELLLD